MLRFAIILLKKVIIPDHVLHLDLPSRLYLVLTVLYSVAREPEGLSDPVIIVPSTDMTQSAYFIPIVQFP